MMQDGARVIFEQDAADRAGELAREIGGQRALLVTDHGIIDAGHTQRVQQSLERAGLAVTVFADVHANPTTADVDACLAVARYAEPDLIIGLGGGSSMDTAKGCNFLLTNGGRMQDYRGVGKAEKPLLPLIAIPTTAGTGSECQSFALIADEHTHQKMACGDKKALPRIAILDPTLTVTQPPHVTACTGIDAVSHAVESAVCTRRNATSVMYAQRSFALTHVNLPTVLNASDNIDARGAMLNGASLAGMAIENSMLGAAHSCANPLTAHCDVVHGCAVGMMLPHVVRYNAEQEDSRAQYDQLAAAGGLDGVDALIDRIEMLLDAAGTPRTMAALDIPRDAIDQLAEEAAGQWTAQFNPRPVTPEDFVRIYEAALG